MGGDLPPPPRAARTAPTSSPPTEQIHISIPPGTQNSGMTSLRSNNEATYDDEISLNGNPNGSKVPPPYRPNALHPGASSSPPTGPSLASILSRKEPNARDDLRRSRNGLPNATSAGSDITEYGHLIGRNNHNGEDDGFEENGNGMAQPAYPTRGVGMESAGSTPRPSRVASAKKKNTWIIVLLRYV